MIFFFTPRRKSAGSLGLWVFHKAKLASKTAEKDRCGLAQFGVSRDTPTEVSAETDAQRTDSLRTSPCTFTSTKERGASAIVPYHIARLGA